MGGSNFKISKSPSNRRCCSLALITRTTWLKTFERGAFERPFLRNLSQVQYTSRLIGAF